MLSRLGCFLCICTICDDSRRRRGRNTIGVLLRRVQSKPLHSKLDIHDDRWSRQLSIPHSLLLCATCSIANFFNSEHQRRNARQHLQLTVLPSTLRPWTAACLQIPRYVPPTIVRNPRLRKTCLRSLWCLPPCARNCEMLVQVGAKMLEIGGHVRESDLDRTLLRRPCADICPISKHGQPSRHFFEPSAAVRRSKPKVALQVPPVCFVQVHHSSMPQNVPLLMFRLELVRRNRTLRRNLLAGCR